MFPHYRKEMKGVDWGLLYNEFGSEYPDTDKTEAEIKVLMMDDDVTAKKGIYEYILSGRERCLNIRTFTEAQKREAYERQDGICPHCVVEGGADAAKKWDITEMEADHIKPWREGGKTTADNCQMLCKGHNRKKSGK